MDRFFIVGSLLTTLATTAVALPAQDSDFGCLDRSQAEAYVQDFHIDVDSFGGIELCNAAVDSKKLFNDLQLVEQGQFTGNKPNLFIRDFVPRQNYFNWLKEQTSGVGRANDVPYATAYNSGGYFTMQDGWAKLSSLGRVGTIIHEARHTEGYYHTNCSHGPYLDTGVSGCDRAIEQGGSHAIEMEYYARVVAQGANFHPVYAEMARLMLIARSNFVFNTSPLAPYDALLARTANGLIQFKNGQRQEWTWPMPIDERAQMKRTSFGASLYVAPTAALAISLPSSSSVNLIEDQYSYYKLLGMAPPPNVRDFEEFDSGTKRYVTVVDQNAKIYKYIFGEGEWSQPSIEASTQRFVTTDPQGHDGLFAVKSSGEFCTLSLSRLSCEGSPQTWPAAAKNFVRFSNQTLQLETNGRVVDEKGQPWPDLQGQKVLDLVKIPAYDVFATDLIN